jgi:ribosomal protein L13E
MQKDRKKQQYLQRLKMLKTRINKGKTRMNKRKTRISAGFSLAEMEGFEPSRHFRTLLP